MKYPISNNGKSTIYVGSSAVLPGENRHFELAEIPLHLRPAQEPAEAEPETEVRFDIAKLQALSAKDLLAQLPDLSTEQLEQLEVAEQADEKPRKGVLAAISESLIARAANAAPAETSHAAAAETSPAAVDESGKDATGD